MNYIVEESCDLRDFPFWSGARDNANQIDTRSDADEIWATLEAFFEDEACCMDKPLTDTFINDVVWFDLENILGFDIYDEEEEDEEEDDDEEEEED